VAEAKVTKITMSCAHRRAGACGECFAAVATIADRRKDKYNQARRRAAAWKRAAKGWRSLAHGLSGQPAVIVRTSRPRFGKAGSRG
jgi:hypothetical protein